MDMEQNVIWWWWWCNKREIETESEGLWDVFLQNFSSSHGEISIKSYILPKISG